MFGRKTKTGRWVKSKTSAKSRKKTNLEEIPVSKEVDETVDACPSCGCEVDVRTVVFDMVDTALPVMRCADAKGGGCAVPEEETEEAVHAASAAESMPADGATHGSSVDAADCTPTVDWDTSHELLLPPAAKTARVCADDTRVQETCQNPVNVDEGDVQQQQQHVSTSTSKTSDPKPAAEPSNGSTSPPSQSSDPAPAPQQTETEMSRTAEAVQSMHSLLKDSGTAACDTLAGALGINQATKTRVRVSVGRCANGHDIDTTPRGVTRGTIFGPGLGPDRIHVQPYTQPQLHTAHACNARHRVCLQNHHNERARGSRGAKVRNKGRLHIKTACRLVVSDGRRDKIQDRQKKRLRLGVYWRIRHQDSRGPVALADGGGPALSTL